MLQQVDHLKNFPASPFAGVTIPAARDALHARYIETQNELLADGSIERTFCALFNAQSMDREHQLAVARWRDGDSRIVQQVINQIAYHRGRMPVRILEVACGRSYGDFEHCGAPWLARVLSKAFGRLVDITISDISKNDIQLFTRDRHGALSSACLRGVMCDWESLKAKWSTSDFQFEFTSADKLERQSPLIMKYLRRRIPWRVPVSFETKFMNEEICLRPAIDPVVEERLFNLKTAVGVNYERLGDVFAPKSFDIVFSRNLPGIAAVWRQRILRSADAVLSNGGVAIINVDGDRSFAETALNPEFLDDGP